MGAAKKQKNAVIDSKIDAKRDVIIGDKTINIYGFEASQDDIKFGIKLTGFLIILFGIAAIWALFVADHDKFPVAHLAGFAAGAFTALALQAFIFLFRLKHNSFNPKKIEHEVQNSN